MCRLKWLAAVAGMAALAACGGEREEMNAANDDLNAVETLPVDNMMDLNAGNTNDVAGDTNAIANATDNSVGNNSTNAY